MENVDHCQYCQKFERLKKIFGQSSPVHPLSESRGVTVNMTNGERGCKFLCLIWDHPFYHTFCWLALQTVSMVHPRSTVHCFSDILIKILKPSVALLLTMNIFRYYKSDSVKSRLHQSNSKVCIMFIRKKMARVYCNANLFKASQVEFGENK